MFFGKITGTNVGCLAFRIFHCPCLLCNDLIMYFFINILLSACDYYNVNVFFFCFSRIVLINVEGKLNIILMKYCLKIKKKTFLTVNELCIFQMVKYTSLHNIHIVTKQ